MKTRSLEAHSPWRSVVQGLIQPSGRAPCVGALLMTLALAPSAWPDCNVSGNVVGYVRVTLPPTPQQMLIANPLNGTNNHLDTILPLPSVGDGAAILRWKPASQSFGMEITFYNGVGWGSADPDPNWLTIPPGEGFFFRNPNSSPLTVTFVGEVPEGNLVTSIPAGFSYLASKVPHARPLGSSGTAGTMGYPAVDGDTAALWRVPTQDYDTYSFFDIYWDPYDPVIGVAQGFLAQKTTPANWIRTFVVSCASGPRLAIALLGNGDVRVSWSALGWKLQEATEPEGPWSAVNGNPMSPYVTPPNVAKKFYRLGAPCVVLDCPTNQVAECAGALGTPVVFTATATNVCAGTNVTVACTPPSGWSFPLGATTVTCIAVAGDETNSCSFTVTVIDTTPPEITCPSNIVLTTAPRQCYVSNVTYAARATDICNGSNLVVACEPPSGSTFGLGTRTVICCATDASGNINCCPFTVTVNPYAICGPDSCPTNYPVTLGVGITNFIANQLDNGGNTLDEVLPVVPDGTQLYKYDPCLKTYTDPATFVAGFGWVQGEALSTMTLAPGEGAFILQPGPSPYQVILTGTRRCARSLPICLVPGLQVVSDQLPEPGNFASIVGMTPADGTVIYTMQGGQYVRYFCVQGEGWVDELGDPAAPVAATGEAWLIDWPVSCIVMQCPSNRVVECQGPAGTPVVFSASASNVCAGTAVPVVCTPPSGWNFPVGVTTVSCVATGCPECVNCTFTVTVRDTLPPEITCSSNIVVAAAPGQCYASNVTYEAAARDICSGSNVTIICNPPSGSIFAVGTTTVLCCATDASGNSNCCSFTVTVRDAEPPHIACPPNILVGADHGQTSRSNVTFSASATDLCAGTNVTIACHPPSGSTFALGTTAVTCWATDPSGNSNSCVFMVTVRQCGPTSCPTWYTILIQPGLNLIANQLDHGRNSLREVLSNVPDGTQLWKFDSCIQANGPTQDFLAGLGWVEGDHRAPVMLAPGEGAWLNNVSGQAFLLTFTGTVRCGPALPPSLVHGWQLVSDQLPEEGNFDSIVGAPPLDGTIVRKWDPIESVFVQYTYFKGSGWEDSLGTPVPAPTTAVGEAWALYWPSNNLACGPDSCPTNYTVTVPVGYSLIANQLDHGRNTLAEVLPSVPDGTQLWKFDPCAQTNGPTQDFIAGIGWVEGDHLSTATLAPGEGALLNNQSGQPFQLIFTGQRRCARQLPIQPVIGLQLVSDQLPEPGNFDSIVGMTPANGMLVIRWNSAGSVYITNRYSNGTWSLGPPTAFKGEAWFFYSPVDTQPPRIVCRDIAVFPDAGQCSKSNLAYEVSATDCAGSVTSIVCSPPAGSTFPLGTTLVTCCATDAAGNRACGTFTVAVKEVVIERDMDLGETIVTWPTCTNLRLRYADTLRCATAWWDIPGATSPHTNRFMSQTHFRGVLACAQVAPPSTNCVWPPMGCPPLPAQCDNGQLSCRLEGNLFTVQLRFWTRHYNPATSSIRICGPAILQANGATLYSLSACNAPNLGGDGWWRLTCPVMLLDGVGGFTLAEQIKQLQDGLWYISVDTLQSPKGEIRGQIWPTRWHFGAVLTCDQVVPPAADCAPVESWSGHAQASCQIDDTVLKVQLKSRALFPITSFRIHGPAGRGGMAPRLYDLSACPAPTLGADGWYYTSCSVPLSALVGYTIPQQVDQLLGGLWYFTLVAPVSPPGEIRGQIEPMRSRFFKVVAP